METEPSLARRARRQLCPRGWDEINALCKLNSIPFNATGEKIRNEVLWCVYEFTWQTFLG
jgi:hypothetical protein